MIFFRFARRSKIRYPRSGNERVLEADFVAGCDGYHGISRASVPAGAITPYEQVYDFAWLGALSRSPQGPRPADHPGLTELDL